MLDLEFKFLNNGRLLIHLLLIEVEQLHLLERLTLTLSQHLESSDLFVLTLRYFLLLSSEGLL